MCWWKRPIFFRNLDFLKKWLDFAGLLWSDHLTCNNPVGQQSGCRQKGTKHPDLPAGDWTGCQMHFKWGRSAFFCSDLGACPWRNVFAPKPAKQWASDKPSRQINLVNDTLYNSVSQSKKYKIHANEIEIESGESNSLQAEWSQSSVQQTWAILLGGVLVLGNIGVLLKIGIGIGYC